jgi:hypothetical protein
MNRNRKNEHGVTIVVVAFILVAILAMAALSIDVAELYVARGEAQRAAEAAALAGAKMFVTSGFTSLQPSGAPEADPTNVCQSGGPGLTPAANVQAEAAATGNMIAGQPAVITSIVCDTSTNPENPRITVSVTRAAVPTFFARIWGRTATTVNATAVAEAYNPSGDATHPATMPVATSVKPWLLPNCDPTTTTCNTPYFVDPPTGNLLNNGSFIGTTISLTQMPNTGGHAKGTGGGPNGPGLTFYPLNIPTSSPTQPVCPSCGAFGGTYRENIACTSQFLMSCGQPISRSDIIKVQTGFLSSSNNTRRGAQCLIHASNDGPDLGQDLIAPATPPSRMPTIQGGTDNPNPSLIGADNISRSDSIVTVPLYNENTPGTPLCSGTNCSTTGNTVVTGFLQLAITQTNGSGPQVQAVILNAAGCSPDSISNFGSVTPVSGSGTSPVPVRLIQKP